MPRQRHDPSLLREHDVYYCEDVQRILGIAQSKAYQIIRRLNKELEADGFITIAGRVSSAYFHERVYSGKDKSTPRPKNK